MLCADIDIADLAILDEMRTFSNSPSCQKLSTSEGEFFWLSHDKILEDLPILGISTKRALINRINKLVDAGLVVRYNDQNSSTKSYYKFGGKYDEYFFLPVNKNSQVGTKLHTPCEPNFTPPVNQTSHNNNTNDNSIIDYKKESPNGDKKEVADKDNFSAIRDLWNETIDSKKSSVIKCRVINDSLKKKIREKLKDISQCGDWKEILHDVFNKICADDFCNGYNDRGWRANLEYAFSRNSKGNDVWATYYERDNQSKQYYDRKYSASTPSNAMSFEGVDYGESTI